MKCLSGRTAGTCVPECPHYGLCHGCGEPANIWTYHSQPSRDLWQGHPTIHHKGHHPKNLGGPGCYSRTGIPAARVRPLVEFLAKTYGSRRAAARHIGLHERTMNHCFEPKHKTLAPTTVEPIVAGVLALRNQKNPDAPHIARLPTALERSSVAEPETIRGREHKRQWRARHALEVSA